MDSFPVVSQSPINMLKREKRSQGEREGAWERKERGDDISSKPGLSLLFSSFPSSLAFPSVTLFTLCPPRAIQIEKTGDE